MSSDDSDRPTEAHPPELPDVRADGVLAGLILVGNGGIATILTGVAAVEWTPLWLLGHVFAIGIVVLGATMATLGMPGAKPSGLRKLARLTSYWLWLWPLVVALGMLFGLAEEVLVVPAVGFLLHVAAMSAHLTRAAGGRWLVLTRYLGALLVAYGVPVAATLVLIGELLYAWRTLPAALLVLCVTAVALVGTGLANLRGRAFRGSTPRRGSDAWRAWHALARRRALDLSATDWGVQLTGAASVQLILQDLPHRLIVEVRLPGMAGTWVTRRQDQGPGFGDAVLDLLLSADGPGRTALARHRELLLEVFTGHEAELVGGFYRLEASGLALARYVTVVEGSCAPTPDLETLLERIDELRAALDERPGEGRA